MNEIWKPIKEYNGDYLISNYGKIKSFKYIKEKILKPSKSQSGYHIVNLMMYGKKKMFKVHRLVAETFIENPNPKKYNQINHIDKNKENNHYLNLEWCTPQYNAEYSNAKKYKLLFPDGHKEIIFNLNRFCKENNMHQSTLYKTFLYNRSYQGYMIVEIINQNRNVKKVNEGGIF
jgi:hypothetical protein